MYAAPSRLPQPAALAQLFPSAGYSGLFFPVGNFALNVLGGGAMTRILLGLRSPFFGLNLL
jgi:hypothetical protein